MTLEIEEVYQIYDGLLNPEEWVEDAIYIMVFENDQRTRIRKGDNICFVFGGVSASIEYRPDRRVLRTIGPIYTSQPIPEPPKMLNRWRVYRASDMEWFNGYVLRDQLVDAQGNRWDIFRDGPFELSSFTCDRFGELPKIVQEAINESKQSTNNR